MSSRLDLILQILESSYRIVVENVEGITMEEALYVPSAGFRSILGTLKHIAGWSYVYRSYAFDAQPQNWQDIAWPHGRRDTIIATEEYFAAVIAWFKDSHQRWLKDLQNLSDDRLDELRPLHWGENAALWLIVGMIARHHVYHAGELNQVLSICRGEAWEEGEEVEENNISTIGHRVEPPWLENGGN